MKRKILTVCSVFALTVTVLPVMAQDQNQTQDPTPGQSQGQSQNQNQNQGRQMPQGMMAAQTATMEATVQSVDRENHSVTLKDTEGNVSHVKLSPDSKVINQLKTGDKVKANLYQSTALAIRKPGEPAVNQQTQRMVMVPPQEPGGSPTRVMMNTTQVTATVQSIDQENRTVTLKGPDGNTMKVKVGRRAADISQLKPGDQIVADVTDAVAISIMPEQQ